MSDLLRPCPDCGELSENTYCAEHTMSDSRPKDRRARGYDAQWKRLSRQARREQPFCSVPGCTSTDLTTDHSPEAWERHEAGLAVRLQDVAVLCRSHNSQKGAAR